MKYENIKRANEIVKIIDQKQALLFQFKGNVEIRLISMPDSRYIASYTCEQGDIHETYLNNVTTAMQTEINELIKELETL